MTVFQKSIAWWVAGGVAGFLVAPKTKGTWPHRHRVLFAAMTSAAVGGIADKYIELHDPNYTGG